MSRGAEGSKRDRNTGHLSPESIALVTGRLHSLLVLSGMSAGELAARSRLPKSTVTDVLRGKSELSLRVMIHLAHGFGLRSLEELIAPLGTNQISRFEFGDDVVA